MAVATAVHAAPAFIERAARLGITHQYTGGWEHFVGGGISAFDCDGDELPELYAAGGSAPAVLLRNRSQPGGDLIFREATPTSLALKQVTGSYPLDLDSDGVLDLVVLRTNDNRLLRGLGECDFTPFAKSLGFVSGQRWSTAFSAMWEPGNVLPTMAVGNYVDRQDPNGPFRACDANLLYRPASAARYSKPQQLSPAYCALSMLFSDWGRRGRMDLRISNDRHYYVRGGSEQLWAMEQQPRLYSAADGWRVTPIWGMGIASRDLNGDGLPEVYLTSMGDQKLQVLKPGASGPEYVDAPYETGVTAHRPHTGEDGRPSTGWHAAFGDVDNDGRDDLFVAKGNVEVMPGNALEDPNNLLMQRADGSFEEFGADAGIASVARSRGAALTDLNLDGLLDLAVVNRNAPIEIYRNATRTAGAWLLLSLRQPAANSFAVGAWLEVRAKGRVQAREITIGGGHVGGHSGYEHFGLGDASHADVRVLWPDGQVSDWQPLKTRQRVLITRDGITAMSLRVRK